jgi:ABC-type antimicrobial peptide transport system permease subunit
MQNNIKTALKVLLSNRLQALLTLCGMSVGVAMVVIVSGLGMGAQQTIEQQIESAGPTEILIRSGNFKPAAIAGATQDSGGGEVSQGGMSDGINDAQANVAQSGAVHSHMDMRKPSLKMKNKTPATPLGEAEMRIVTTEVSNIRSVAGGVEGNVSVDADSSSPLRVVHLRGFQPAWPEMRSWHLSSGRWPTEEEHAKGMPVAIVTAVVAARLWPGNTDPLGKSVKIAGQEIEVVGVLIPKNQGDDGASTVVPNISVPLALAQALLNRTTFDSITVRTTSVGVTSTVAKDIKERFRKLHELPEDVLEDFRVETQSVSAMPSMGLDPRLARAVHSNVAGFEQASWEEMARSLRQAGRTFTLLLAAAATVSLVVGGIGVMNIMLVSVAARTREIGLRMAMGAQTGDVLTQFLVEAVTLAALGGVIGLVLGAIGLAIAKHGFHWATAISPTMLALAVAMAAVTGIVFGFGPARRAAVLDPVIALRSE